MNSIIYDIETAPLPEKELAAILPPFDPAEVKTGNIKDPEKVAAKIAEAEANHHRDALERAALDPLTGRVLAIGLLSAAGVVILENENEAALLEAFWNACRSGDGRITQMVGFNSNVFDLPFLIRRSWKHRVPIPPGLRRGRYWNEAMVDLHEIWQLGDRMAKGSLDSIAKHLGVGAKTGDGKDFAALYRTDRPKALAYLRNDLDMTYRVAVRLGAI